MLARSGDMPTFNGDHSGVRAWLGAHRRIGDAGSKGGRPPTFDAESYRRRNVVERAINKLKGHRAVTTRYDKRDYMFRGRPPL